MVRSLARRRRACKASFCRQVNCHQQRQALFEAQLPRLFAFGQLAQRLRHAVQPHGFEFVQSWLL